MGVARNMAKEVIKEIGNKSREFYEFVLPPIDMQLEENTLTVTVDMPGFTKKDIKVRMNGNILSINAEKQVDEKKDGMICNQRPNVIDKKIRLPVRIKEGEEKVDSAKYTDGILTLKITTIQSGKEIPLE